MRDQILDLNDKFDYYIMMKLKKGECQSDLIPAPPKSPKSPKGMSAFKKIQRKRSTEAKQLDESEILR